MDRLHQRSPELGEGPVADPPHGGGRDPHCRPGGPNALGVDPIPEPEEQPQHLRRRGPEAREFRAGASAVDRQDGPLFGRGARRIAKPLGE